jgi:hypothetical protein
LLGLAFEGWAQCRLATDPDPSDEPRGVSGWTFAIAGEPDLDRVLRFQPEGATPRVPGPAIGVHVTTVSDAGAGVVSALEGARVDLLGEPVFEGRNGLAYEDTMEPIFPVHLRVETARVTLERAHADAAGQMLMTPPGRPSPPPAAAAAAIGVATDADRKQFRTRRSRQLRDRLAHADSPTEKAALERRLRAFAPGAPTITTDSLGFALPYDLPLAGPDAVVDDPDGVLGSVDRISPWRLNLSVGIWDADALCAYVLGRLDIPEGISPP